MLAIAPNAYAGTATAAECGNPEATAVNVEQVFDDVQYEFYQPMLRIKELADSGETGAQRENWPVGLSTGKLFVRMADEVQSRHLPNSAIFCGTLKTLTLRLGFSDNSIYVAKEFPLRSCPHREVLKHEEHHKAVDRQLLQEYAEKARYLFTDLANSAGIVTDANAGMLESELTGRINDELKKFTATMNAERARRQKDVDSESEYARVSASCNGQLMEVVNQRLELIRSTEPSFAARVGGGNVPSANTPAATPDTQPTSAPANAEPAPAQENVYRIGR